MTSSGAATRTYIAGVPHALPEGEQLLWEGAPAVRAVARHVFHQRAFAVYFGVMLMLWIVGTDAARTSPEFLAGLGVRVGLAGIVLAILEVLARVVARTTWYAITSKRLVLRIGMVIPMSINVPFSVLESADVARFRDGTGQLLLRLVKGHRIAYIALWPHCRVFGFNQPSPLLRGLADPSRVGELLASAVASAEGTDRAPVARANTFDGARTSSAMTAARA